MLDVTVGHAVDCAIVYLDQNGNPMLVQPVPDRPPAWSHNPNPAGCDSLTPSADGTTAVVNALAVGQDSVGLSLIVSGATFTASLQLNIAAAPQVLTSVGISTTVN